MNPHIDSSSHACSVQCNRPLQWAARDGVGVLTLSGGHAYVVVAAISDRWDVFVVYLNGRFGKRLGSFESEKRACKAAIDEAHRMGLDHLGFRGAWREKKATAAQIRALRSHKVSCPRTISAGAAANLIALNIAEDFLERNQSSKRSSAR